MKNFLLIMTLVWSCSTLASGSSVRGGGDLCEDRIKTIRDDIKEWINQHGPQKLILPAGVSLQQYSIQMTKQISNARIQCVGRGDTNYPVTVNGTPKVCEFNLSSEISSITWLNFWFIDFLWEC